MEESGYDDRLLFWVIGSIAEGVCNLDLDNAAYTRSNFKCELCTRMRRLYCTCLVYSLRGMLYPI